MVSGRKLTSCLPCRSRKLRCDRALPACGNCVDRNEITDCRYVTRQAKPRATPQASSELSIPARDRIDRLEHLMVTLLNNPLLNPGQVNPFPNHSQLQQDPNIHSTVAHQGLLGKSGSGSGGNLRVANEGDPTTSLTPSQNEIRISADHGQRRSVDEAHWALLLNEISEVRSYLRTHHRKYEQHAQQVSHTLRQSSDPGPPLLLGTSKSVNRADILSHLPSRYHCDTLITRFFAHLYPALHILHIPTFYKQYELAWTNKNSTSIVWFGILFAILRITMLDYIREGEEPIEYTGRCQELAISFRDSFTDCLILADYTQPHEFLIEALVLHKYAEYVSSRDARSSVWVLSGMIIRMAMRMGYHQSSQVGLNLSPFQAEMRRRTWAFIRQSDILSSFQIGLPSTVESSTLDGSLPLNIHDDDSFDEQCAGLPRALPDTEPTQIAFLLAKTRLAFGFANAMKQLSTAEILPRERVLDIDRELRQIYDTIPAFCKLGPLSDRDSLVLVSFRFALASIHHKSLCVLHSRFLERGKTDDRYLYSRRACLSSAMEILRFQAIQNLDLPVDGGSRSLTHYQTSLAIHDYLLAATILSAELLSKNPAASPANHRDSQGLPTRLEMAKALSTSARIFSQMSDQSMEAYKAADVLGMLLQKFEQGLLKPVQRSNDVQQPVTSTLLNTINTGSMSYGSPSQQQTLHGLSSCPSDITTPSTNVDAGAKLEVTIPRYMQHLTRSPSRPAPLSTDNGVSVTGRRRPLEQPDLNSFANWAAAGQVNLCGDPPRFPPTCPVSGPSYGWTMPEWTDPSLSVHDTHMTSVPLAAGNPPSVSAAFSLNDPMSALWNLNSGNQLDFDMTTVNGIFPNPVN